MLLQLYAIECGLKLILLQRRQQHSTADLADDDRTHDLDTLLKRLNASLKDRIGNYKAQDPRGAGFMSSGRLHELFRYGGAVSQSDQVKLGQSCATILQWIEDEDQR